MPRQQNTKERIRTAARKEFSDKGLSGARVDRIAKTANVNIRMIYYFFGSKRGLLEDVLGQVFLDRKPYKFIEFDNLADLLAFYYDFYGEDLERVRLLQWEALETPAESAADLTNFEERRRRIHKRIESIERMQAAGAIPSHLDPMFVYLMSVALPIYPLILHQNVLLATGTDPASPDFRKKYREFLKEVGRLLARAEMPDEEKQK